MKIKLYILSLIILGLFMAPIFVLAQDDKYGLDKTAKPTSLSKVGISNQTPEALVLSVVNTALMFVGTIFFLLILYAGISWMTAQGASDKVNKAKGMLETALIGLLIVVASYAISTYIFTRISTVPEEAANTTPIQ